MAEEYEPAGTSSTAGFVPYRGNDGSWRVIPATGTGSAGSGTVWENPTRGLPVSNPMQSAVGEMSVSQSTLSKVLNVLELGEVHLMARDRFVDAPQLDLPKAHTCIWWEILVLLFLY